MANGMGLLTPQESHNHHPQTPAQQVLMSAADRWGLLGLLDDQDYGQRCRWGIKQCWNRTRYRGAGSRIFWASFSSRILLSLVVPNAYQ
jgi:hypothetical protein